MRKLLVIHPFMFAVYPILFYYSYNKEELLLNILTLPLSIAVVFTLIFYSLLVSILKDWKKAGLIVSLFLLLFYSYGHFLDLVFPNGRFLNLFRFRFLVGGFVIGPNKVFSPYGSSSSFLTYILLLGRKKTYVASQQS